MNLGKKLVSVAAGVALVAGAGLAASAPASAAAKPAFKGATGIAVPMALIGAASAAGVTIAPIAPARAQATTDVVNVLFPVSGPLMDGVLHHRGGLSLTSATTQITLTVTSPTIEWATSGGDTAEIKGEIGGIPDSSPFAALNGQRAGIFKVSNFDEVIKKGKITKAGKMFKRTWTITQTGDVAVTDSQTVVDAINGFMGVPLFTAGMDFGTLDTSYTITHTCKTKKECA
jgi:hypothetical protein